MEKTTLFFGFFVLLSISMYIQMESTSQKYMDYFESWKKNYNKIYNSRENLYRYFVFIDNLQKIQLHNTQQKSYTLTINQFADLTEEEFQERYLNSQLSDNIIYRQLDSNYQVKVSTDFSNLCQPIKDQGACVSGWAFAAVGSLECNYNIEQSILTSLSVQDLIDCSTYQGNYGCGGGLPTNAFKYVKKSGIAYEIDYPYRSVDGNCKAVQRNLTISNYLDLYTCGHLSDAIQHRTVAVLVNAGRWQFYEKGVFSDCQSKDVNHGVLVVGVDAFGVWKVKNSWGVNWGDEGYIYLAKGDTCAICQAPSYPIF